MSSDCCGSSVDTSALEARQRQILSVVLIVNAAAFVMMVYAAWHSGSSSLLSGALDNFGDALTYALSFAAVGAAAANSFCLALLHPYRHGDVNMSSVWECSRNDVLEGIAVIGAALAVGVFGSGWPDLLIATALLALFLRSAFRLLRRAWTELGATPAPA